MKRYKFRESLRKGEILALDPKANIFDLFFCPPKENEEIEGAVIVHINGPMDHHMMGAHEDYSPYGIGESYEGIRKRFGEAAATSKPCIIIKMDSPGGVVSGLNQAVIDMKRVATAMNKHVIVYVDEKCCSAAYALACVGDEIITPPSGLVGSVGVISHMCDVVGADKKAGLNFKVLTSGAAKADGHEHVPISEEAEAREQKAVDQLAGQFFRLVEKYRGFDPAPLEAEAFLGDEAVSVGLADAVMGWESLLTYVDSEYESTAASGTAQTKPQPEANMIVSIRKMIADAKKKMAKSKDAKRKAVLAAQIKSYESTLTALKKTKYKLEEEETVEGEEEEAPDHGDEEEEEDADDMPGDKPEHDDDEAEEEDPEDEEEESDEDPDKEEEAVAAGESPFKKKEKKGKAKKSEEEAIAKALATLPARARGALTARLEKAGRYDALQADVAVLKADRIAEKKGALIGNALRQNRITKSHSTMLAGKPLSFVRGFLEMHKKAIFHTNEEQYVPLDKGNPSGSSDPRAAGNYRQYDEAQMKMFRLTAGSMRCSVQEAIDAYEKKAIRPNGSSTGPKLTRPEAGLNGSERN